MEKTWKRVAESDKERLSKLVIPRGVSFRTFRYVEDDNPLHTLSIYWPSNRTSDSPVVIDIHGGGWMYGSKEVNRPFDISLASLGVAVVGISFRLLPQTDLSGMLQDIFKAVEFAYSKRIALRLDFTKTFITGDSAGGQLAGLITGMQELPFLLDKVGVKPFPFKIRAVNFNHPVPYIKDSVIVSAGRLASRLGVDEMMRMMFGPRLFRDKKYAKLCSDFDALIADVKSFPPSLITTSTGDRSFNAQAHHLYETLKNRGVEVELFEVPDEKHVYNVIHMDTPIGIKANKRIVNFFMMHQGRD